MRNALSYSDPVSAKTDQNSPSSISPSLWSSLSSRLMAGLMTLAIIGVVVGVIGLYFLSSVEKTLNEITDVAAPSVETTGDMIANIWETNKIAEEIIADEELHDIEELKKEFVEKSRFFYVYYDELAALITDEALLANMQRAKQEHAEFLENSEKMIKAHTEELLEEAAATRLLADFDKIGGRLIQMLDEFAEENEQEMAKAQEEGDRLVASGRANAADLNAILSNLFEREYPVVEAALKLQRIIVEMQDTAGEYLAIEDPNQLGIPLKDFNDLATRARPLIEILSTYAETDEDRSDAANVKSTFDSWFSTATLDEQLFDTHRDMLEQEYAADAFTEALESDADNVAASLDKIANVADAISDGADEKSAAKVLQAQWATGIAVMLLIALSVVLMLVIRSTIISPIKHMTGAMQILASGGLDVTIPSLGKKDEIGQMAGAVQVFKENALETENLRKEQLQNEERLEAEKRRATLEMADNLEASVMNVVENVSTAADDMKRTAQTMSDASEQTSLRTASVSSASEEATITAQTVAAAAEELSLSIQEITRQMAEAQSVASSGQQQAESTNKAVKGLSDGAQQIGDVVGLINDIAEQTNLLALNATIEAARAGEMGRGFAVVAAEVKELASQTAKATEDIRQQINAMQQSTGKTVDEIQMVVEAMAKIGDMTTIVSASVGQQNVATQEIARNIQQTAAGTQDVTTTIAEVDATAQQSSEAASNVVSVVGQLDHQSDILKKELRHFLESLRAA